MQNIIMQNIIKSWLGADKTAFDLNRDSKVNPTPDYGRRQDGTPKGRGYKGPVYTPKGTAPELTVGRTVVRCL